MSNHSIKFHKDLISTFWVTLLKDKHTDRQTNRHWWTYNWRALQKKQICSTTMKQRKSLVKPVTRQNISSCLVHPSEIVMNDAFNVILWTSADMCVVVHDNLGRKNQTARYNCKFSGTSLALWVIFVWRKSPPIYASCMTISGGRTEQHVVISFGELAAVD